MWTCDNCKEDFGCRDEVVFLCGVIIVEDEEHGGSGDIDHVFCSSCYEEDINKI